MSAISFVIGAHTYPEVLRTIQATHSWLADSAAMITSPSFSRPSSSATMIGRPARSASSATGMSDRLMRMLLRWC